MIPNCIDCRRFSYKEEVRYEIRKQLGFSNDDFVIGHIGRFYEPKNHPFLLEVFRKVKEKNNHAKLVLVGDGEGRGAAEYVVDKYNLRSSVLFLGIQQKPELFYQAMDLFLFPSLWEGLPLTVVEAQAAGLPCVISDTITKDVHLTNLIQAVPLAKSADEWADIIVNVQVNTCRDLNAENKVKLSRFDSIEVVRTLEAFYGRIVENFNN